MTHLAKVAFFSLSLSSLYSPNSAPSGLHEWSQPSSPGWWVPAWRVPAAASEHHCVHSTYSADQDTCGGHQTPQLCSALCHYHDLLLLDFWTHRSPCGAPGEWVWLGCVCEQVKETVWAPIVCALLQWNLWQRTLYERDSFPTSILWPFVAMHFKKRTAFQ